MLILLFCWRELLHILATMCIIVGFVIGAAPLILYNLNAAPGEDSLTTLRLLQRGGGSIVYTKALLLKELSGTIKISIPMMTGNPFCPVSELAFLIQRVNRHSNVLLFVAAGASAISFFSPWLFC
jgi:hypothetical protein